MVSFRVSDEFNKRLDKVLATSGKTKAELFIELFEGSVYASQEETQAVYRSVCVGEKLAPNWELKEFYTEKVGKRVWLVFPDDEVVAFWTKSANGSKTFLEVGILYDKEVWEYTKAISNWQYKPLSALKNADKHISLIKTKKEHPLIQVAINKGWVNRAIQSDQYDLLETVELAEEYLALMEVSEPTLTTQPQIEARTFNTAQFLKEYPNLNNDDHSALCAKSNSEGYVQMLDGSRWARTGKLWVEQLESIQSQSQSGTTHCGAIMTSNTLLTALRY